MKVEMRLLAQLNAISEELALEPDDVLLAEPVATAIEHLLNARSALIAAGVVPEDLNELDTVTLTPAGEAAAREYERMGLSTPATFNDEFGGKAS